MPLLVWLALGLAWSIDHIAGTLRAVLGRRRPSQRILLDQARHDPVPDVATARC